MKPELLRVAFRPRPCAPSAGPPPLVRCSVPGSPLHADPPPPLLRATSGPGIAPNTHGFTLLPAPWRPWEEGPAFRKRSGMFTEQGFRWVADTDFCTFLLTAGGQMDCK